VRFPAFSGSHGWQWFREIDLKNSSVWTYDLATNTWRDRRPVPEPRVSPLRCASWDSDHEVIVVFGGEHWLDPDSSPKDLSCASLSSGPSTCFRDTSHVSPERPTLGGTRRPARVGKRSIRPPS
jgi:hypothetical protein